MQSIEFGTSPSGQDVVLASKQGLKRIKFDLPENGDLQSVAQLIIDGSKLLHAQRQPEVAALLALAAKQQHAAAEAAAAAPSQPERPLEARHHVSEQDRQLLRAQQQQYLAAAASSATQVLASAAVTASLERLEDYVEALYEDELGAKIAAAAAVAQLFRDPHALGTLQGHPALLQALARLLREDAKKSGELCISLLMVFFALSHLPAGRTLLVQNQVGSLTMELLDLELRRAEHWQQREGVAVADVGAKLLAGEALAPSEARLAGLLARQEPLLYVGLSLLLNMAEADVGVEAKMVKKGLLSLLVVLLDRGSPQLLLLVTTFLHRLSLFADNCCPLRESEVVGQLVAMLPSGDGLLLCSLLRLLHNLAFDEGMRQQMVAAGLITKAVDLLKGEAPRSSGSGGGGIGSGRPSTAAPWRNRQNGVPLEGAAMQHLVLGILYRLSLQDRHRSMFLYTDAPATLHAMLLTAELPLAASSRELAALLVSLAESQRVAEELARGGRLEQLLEFAVGPAEPMQSAADAAAGGFGAEDELLWKLLRAMAVHDSEPLRARFGPALPRVVQLLMSGTLPPAAFLEALGCLAQLDIPGYNYASLLRSTGLHDFLAQLAAAGGTGAAGACSDQAAVLLEVLQAIGVMCANETCASMLAAAGLVDALHTLMLEHMEEEAFVLATTAAAARLLAQPPTRASLLAHPEVAARFAELLHHQSKDVARAADAALDAIAAASDEWSASVRRLKFERHNREFLQLCGIRCV
ncbi:hypothetical protein ABPG75_000852 [Micractinium tetrahymenae]